MKGTGFHPGGKGSGEDWMPSGRALRWQPGAVRPYRAGILRVAAALLIFLALFILKETNHPRGVAAREKLKEVLTTEWDYRPVLEKAVQFGLQMANYDWKFLSSPQPVVSRPAKVFLPPNLSTPVSGKIIRGYGMVADPVDGMERFHSGIDIEAPVGSPVRAVSGGVVKRAGEGPALGKYVLIEHGPGCYTLYGSLSRAVVIEGQEVAAGQAIGEAGNTGDFAGSGVHFEVREDGVLVNPLTKLKVDSTR